MDNKLSEIRRIYDDYIADTVRLETGRKPSDGLLGFGHGPGSDPCHDRFAGRLEQALESVVSAAPSSREARAVLEFIYGKPGRNEKNMLAYWMLLAVHTLTEKLIGFLSPEDAACLTTLYFEANPKSTRLPVQKKIAAHLRAQAGDSYNNNKRRSFLDIIKGLD